MRRTLAVVLSVGLLTLAVSASATETANYKDKFNSGWGGSDGSLAWSGPWVPQGGAQVVSSGNCAQGSCMRLSGLLPLGGISASRAADTGELDDIVLSYDLEHVVPLLSLGLTVLLVEARTDSGWQLIREHSLTGNSSGHFAHDLEDFSSADFQLRFRVTGLAMTSQVFIDNVEILGTLIEEPTTTTTTVAPTTTTTVGDTTTTSQPPTTTTTRPRTTTTTNELEPTTPTSTPGTPTLTTTPGPDEGITATTKPSSSSSSTTTTTTGTTPIGATTDEPGSGGGDNTSLEGTPLDGTPPDGSGIRAAARGLQANFQGDLYGEVRTVSALNGVDLQADYNMAVEVIRSSWAWMVLLGLLIAWAIVTGLDRRRRPLTD